MYYLLSFFVYNIYTTIRDASANRGVNLLLGTINRY